MKRPSTPKRSIWMGGIATDWFRYYAGFSSSFVRDVLSGLSFAKDDLVADPWNGAGTTTAVAQRLGFRSWGGDINPVMAVVAKARLLGGADVRPSERSLCESALSSAVLTPQVNDPLRAWFNAEAVAEIRGLEVSISRLLDPSSGLISVEERVAALSPLAAFFYVVLFRTVRQLVLPFGTSNPTWIRRPRDERNKLRPTRKRIHDLFREQLLAFNPAYDRQQRLSQKHEAESQESAGELLAAIQVASSTKLPLGDDQAAAVVASPPYCTRLDYAVATAAELAALGLRDEESRRLRESMIGSTTVAGDVPNVELSWGPTCCAFLDQLAHHKSKASSSYYLKSHLRYFDRLARSIAEINRVLRPDSPCVLVVQDSHYKELHNDLATIVCEMGEAHGWTRKAKFEYVSKRHMGRVHPGTRAYRTTPGAIESAVFLQTARI